VTIPPTLSWRLGGVFEQLPSAGVVERVELVREFLASLLGS